MIQLKYSRGQIAHVTPTSFFIKSKSGDKGFFISKNFCKFNENILTIMLDEDIDIYLYASKDGEVSSMHKTIKSSLLKTAVH